MKVDKKAKERERKLNPVLGLLMHGALAVMMFGWAYLLLGEQRIFAYLFFFLLGIGFALFGINLLYEAATGKQNETIFVTAAVICLVGGIFFGLSLFEDYPLGTLMLVGVYVLFIIVTLKIVIPGINDRKKELWRIMEEKGITSELSETQDMKLDSEEKTERTVRTFYVREKREIERGLHYEKMGVYFALFAAVIPNSLLIIYMGDFQLYMVSLAFVCFVGLPLTSRFILRRIRLIKDYRKGYAEVIKGTITKATSYWPFLFRFNVGDYRFWIEDMVGFYFSNGERIEVVRGPSSKRLIRIKVKGRELYMP